MPTAQEIINGLTVEEDADFSEVEHRITTAQYYRLLLNDSLFNDDTSLAARQVETEIRDFVKQRIRILVGLETPKLQVVERDPVFSADEIVALKELAHKLLGTTVPQPAESVPAVKASVPGPMKMPLVKKAPPPKKINKPTLRRADVPDTLKSETATSEHLNSPKGAAVDGPQPGEVGSVEHVELEPNPKTGAPRIKKNGKILERGLNPNDGSIIINAQGGEVWLDITPPARPAPGSGYKPMPSPDALANLALNEATLAKGRVDGGALAGIAELFMK